MRVVSLSPPSQQFQAHKAILCARSDLYRSLCADGTLTTVSSQLSSPALQDFLRFSSLSRFFFFFFVMCSLCPLSVTRESASTQSPISNICVVLSIVPSSHRCEDICIRAASITCEIGLCKHSKSRRQSLLSTLLHISSLSLPLFSSLYSLLFSVVFSRS